MERQFDQAFLELLKSGSRHDQANYRNCIIDEERRRANHQDIRSIRQDHKDITRFYKDGRDLTSISVCLEMVFIFVGIVFVITFFMRRQYASAIIMLAITFLNCLSLKINLARFKFFHHSYKQLNKGKVIIIVPRTGGEDSFSEIFKVISSDTEEVLRDKKAKLDEILGL